MSAAEPRSFGVEEEYLLLDAEHGTPVDLASVLVRSASDEVAPAEREFFSSQLETATPVCRTAGEALETLAGFRAELSRRAADRGAVLASSGLPPLGGEEAGTVTPKPRYRELDAEMRGAAAHQYVTGTHVHIGVPSPDAGVEVLARLASWAPALIAMTANSPIWCGEPSGFASWRHIRNMTWPLAGYPPEFASGEEYAREVERLVTSGVLLDAGVVTWLARLSERYPTVELRIADAQLTADDAVDFALIARALVERALAEAGEGKPRPGATPGLVSGAIWMAARDGLSGTLIDPVTARAVPAHEMLEGMVASVEGELRASGDLERVRSYLARLRATGGPARRQLERFAEGGVQGLLGLYREASGAA
ncbi:carboxylate-amine ligase [Leucobacter massiliensis]|uniref:Putative glutamate--cysteine ligase 2 n=1 Tax=Leucobacter massiliensis TaxID=1686285 RepID=A0A2S9QL81_9MICO|nr:YbdK family carboxylate-amine ligase [Leucobacter massiliensis]PRI10348.1 carboxylate--amine ligase [Leucobacter massiliensis]